MIMCVGNWIIKKKKKSSLFVYLCIVIFVIYDIPNLLCLGDLVVINTPSFDISSFIAYAIYGLTKKIGANPIMASINC